MHKVLSSTPGSSQWQIQNYLSSCTSCTIYSLYDILLTNTWFTFTTILVGKPRSYATFAEICSRWFGPSTVCLSVAGNILTHTWQEREDDDKENENAKWQSYDCHIYIKDTQCTVTDWNSPVLTYTCIQTPLLICACTPSSLARSARSIACCKVGC